MCVYIFVTNFKAGLTKGMVFHKGGLSKEVLLYVFNNCDRLLVSGKYTYFN